MCAGTRVAVFEKAHALMNTLRVTESIRKLLGRDGDVAERAHWFTLTRIPGSVWPTVSLLYITEKSLYKALTYLCCSIETSDVEVRQGFFMPYNF